MRRRTTYALLSTAVVASLGGVAHAQFYTGADVSLLTFMQQEQALLSALKATTAYKVDGNTLELLNGSQSLAKFQAEGK